MKYESMKYESILNHLYCIVVVNVITWILLIRAVELMC